MSRIERINAELKKQLSIILQDGIEDPRLAGKIICVTDAKVDKDLTLAQIYVSVLGAENDEKTILDGLASAEGYIKSELKSKIKLRNMPALRFFYDDSAIYGRKISKILDELNTSDNKQGE